MNYDYIEIEDRKSHQQKGIFIPKKYADEVKALIDEKLIRERQEKKNTILKFAGALSGEIGDLTIQEIKSLRNRES